MRTKTLAILLLVAMGAALSGPAQGASRWDATVKLGGVYVDEVGDLSTVQETYNIYDGFNLSQIRLSGAPEPRSYLMLDLRDINLDSRKGDVLYRHGRVLKLSGSYDQHRQVFDPARNTSSDRKDWNVGAQVNPTPWISLSGSYGELTRKGDRLSFPLGTQSVLGASVDNKIRTGRVGVEAQEEGSGIALEYEFSDYEDHENADAHRSGRVVSARAFAPGFLLQKMSHFLRAAVGVSELSTGNIDYTLAGVQYTGVYRPWNPFQFKYRFDGQRIDNESTSRKTDRFQNDVDATYYHRHGNVYGGYGYETNDDDRRLTSYHSWRVGGSWRAPAYDARVQYAGRVKKDYEELTLLKDVEASRFRGDLEVRPIPALSVNGAFHVREREFPDIRVKAEGQTVSGGARYTHTGWGKLSGTYTYANDEYTDLVAGYEASSSTVTARADLERIPSVVLSGGVTYLDAGKDIDIEKSILFFEGTYTFRNDLHFEVKYNVYNYDDYILLDRYYTANVVWFNVAYDLHVE